MVRPPLSPSRRPPRVGRWGSSAFLAPTSTRTRSSCVCCSITASTSSGSQRGPRTGCSGTSTTSIPSSPPRRRGLTAKRTRRSLQVRLARREQCVRSQIARELLGRLSALCARESELESQIARRTEATAPQLLDLPGCGPLAAAKLIAECAGAERFPTDASSPAPPGWRRCRSPRGGATATASTAAATASSTAPFTGSR